MRGLQCESPIKEAVAGMGPGSVGFAFEKHTHNCLLSLGTG